MIDLYPTGTVGYFNFRFLSVLSKSLEISKLRLVLESAGTICQGACSVEVALIACSYDCMYCGQRARSFKSFGLNFQVLVESSNRSCKRFFCSSLEMCKKHLISVVPVSVSKRSKSLICA